MASPHDPGGDPLDAAEIVGLLAEPERLRVLSALVLGARSATEIGAATGLDARAVGRALQKLQAGGLVDGALAVQVDAIKEAAIAAAPAASTTGGDVVSRFVRDGRLHSLPAQDGKRRQVLEFLVQSFEPGRRFDEREVDAVLRAWTAGGEVDHVSVRRYLVDHGLLAREGGDYWRIGGWVDVS
jgi:hypothetical protein